MGKRIIARARGKGGPRYRAPSFRYLGRVEYHPFPNITGRVVNIVHDPARSAPVAIIRFEDGKILLHIASEGLGVDRTIVYNKEIEIGNVTQLEKIPIGTKIFGIETFPGSGPKLCRAAGSFATVIGRTGKTVTLQFTSGAIKDLDPKCRATIGIPAGAGRVEKPWVKAGKKVRAMMARGKLYPRTVGVAMGAVDHPHGGRAKSRRPAVSRRAPAGAKVGTISPRRMGRRKGR
ncbi:MAG: 50S ribosomal protein L2 [Candidatus Aenigmarchaeota archaeon]|nr:50S ribosomal protein L2 [Candidatus Aenigmarchaeota archaeon]